MCRNHIKLGAFLSCKREFYAGLCSLSLLVARTSEQLLDHAVPSSAPCPALEGHVGGTHGNIPPLTLRGETRVPSPSLGPGKKGQHPPGETSHGMFGII